MSTRMTITTFEEDLLGLSDFRERLEKFIVTEERYVEGSLVLALSSKYGSGKTTFLNMWKSSLESTRGESVADFVVYLNAWESDYYGDPLFAIISALVEQLNQEEEKANDLIAAAKDFGWFSTAIAGQIVKKLTGVDAVAAGEVAEKKKKKSADTTVLSPDSFTLYMQRKDAMETLKVAIQAFVDQSKPRVIFLVDELDRCRPDYAISYLETIKHIFDLNGAVFILAADRNQLENSAKTAFGRNLDFEEYYRKFIHREVSLPPISEEGYKKLSDDYISRYLEHENSRFCMMPLDTYRREDISEFIGGLKLTPRQIQEVFRILGHILSTSEERQGKILWCLGVGSILMASLKVGNSQAYNQIGNNSLPPNEAKKLLSFLETSAIRWWFLIIYTGGGLRLNEGDTIQEVLIEENLADKDEFEKEKLDLGQLNQGWGRYGHGGARMTEIYNKIEQVIQWN
jgi:hypothetical protein